MNDSGPVRHGRPRATTVAIGLLTIAALVLVVIGIRGQVHAATPPASAAHRSAEGDLPAPATSGRHSDTSTGGSTPRSPGTTSSVVGPVLDRSRPVALTIPAIGITHSHLAAYGTDAQGAIDVPPAVGGVPAGWYTGSPTPGQLGPAVIVGHTDAKKDQRSIFFRLGELRPGDKVHVTRADDIVATFEIDSLEHYPKAKFPTATVYGNINHAGLRLISCIGKFDTSTGHYLDNIVVFAHLVGSQRS